jgi:hypothetical protein
MKEEHETEIEEGNEKSTTINREFNHRPFRSCIVFIAIIIVEGSDDKALHHFLSCRSLLLAILC